MTQYAHSDLTSKIIGCAIRIHSKLGLGFPEKVYQNALIIELKKENLFVEFEIEADVYYEMQWVGSRRLDLLVEKKVLIELKAFDKLEQRHINQILNYLNAFNIEIGLLLNFGNEKLQFHRYFNKNYMSRKQD